MVEMSIAGLAKKLLPAVAYESIVRKKKERERSRLARLPRLTEAYCVDDAMKEEFPARVYHDRVFAGPCIDYDGKTQIVETYAHNMRIIDAHEGPNFFRSQLANDVCADLTIKGMKFFRADARRFFDDLLALAKQGITVYPRSVYSK